MGPVHITRMGVNTPTLEENLNFQGQTELDPWQLTLLTTHTTHCLSFLSQGKDLKFKDNPNLHWAWQMAQLIKHLQHKFGDWRVDPQINAGQICQGPVSSAAGKQMGAVLEQAALLV